MAVLFTMSVSNRVESIIYYVHTDVRGQWTCCKYALHFTIILKVRATTIGRML